MFTKVLLLVLLGLESALLVLALKKKKMGQVFGEGIIPGSCAPFLPFSSKLDNIAVELPIREFISVEKIFFGKIW